MMLITRRPKPSRIDPEETRRLVARFCDQFIHDGGHAVIAPTPPGLGPSDKESESSCIVLEDGVPLAAGHALHEDIRQLGAGRFSHWGETIYFSSSDHTDPNTNGRRYEVDPKAGGPPVLLHPSFDGIRFATPAEMPRRLLRRMPIANRWCVGEGIEIGATSYNTIRGLNALNVGRRLDWTYIRECMKLSQGWVRVIDVVAEGDDLPIDSESTDFVFSSHVLEHFPDTIKALKEWDRVLRVGGIMFAIVPHKERTFDRDQPRTPLSHLFEVHGTVPTGPRLPDRHYSVWITEDLVNLVGAMNDARLVDWEIVAVEGRDSNRGNGFTVVCRKRSVVD